VARASGCTHQLSAATCGSNDVQGLVNPIEVVGWSQVAVAAERLVISEATVKTHVASILRKHRMRDRAQAVVLADESGLI
jgi:hypothetical protein